MNPHLYLEFKPIPLLYFEHPNHSKGAETRTLIDQQLIESDWEADSENLRYSKGARPIANQISAIRAVEKTIKDEQTVAQLGMSTGTGKTKTAIALAYRLLESERFRRILFLVDRSALGVQTSDDFSEVRLENLNTFADDFWCRRHDTRQNQKARTRQRYQSACHHCAAYALQAYGLLVHVCCRRERLGAFRP